MDCEYFLLWINKDFLYFTASFIIGRRNLLVCLINKVIMGLTRQYTSCKQFCHQIVDYPIPDYHIPVCM